MKFKEHPYLIIGNMNLREKAEAVSFLWQPILKKANEDLTRIPILPMDADGWLWEDLDRTKERILRGCVVYLITSENKYFEAMKRQLWCLIDDWPWIEKFHHEEIKLEADLRTGIIMFTLGLVYDWMYNEFTPEERIKIKTAITDRGYEMLKKDISNDAMYLNAYGNNWLAVMLGGFAVASLAIYNESDFAKEIVEMAIERTLRMSDHVGNDGAWEEGPFYWGGIAFLILFFDILDSLPGQKNAFLKKSSLLKTCMFPLYMNMPGGGRANFSDAHYNQDHNAAYLFSIMGRVDQNTYYQWAFKQFREVAEESKPELSRIGINDFRPHEETYQFLAYDHTLESKYPTELPLFKVFQGETYGFASSRGGFGRYDESLVLCANGGTNGTNHHQLDIGQLIMTFKKHNFISDPGYGRAFYINGGEKVNNQNYFAKSSMGHNIVTIDGANQIDSPDARGIIETIDIGPDKHEFKITMDSAYERCLGAVRRVERFLADNTVAVTDEFLLEEKLPTRLAWFYNGEASVIDDNTIEIKYESSICEIRIESNTAFVISLEHYTEEGMHDRNNKSMSPTKYNYISIAFIKTTSLNIISTFTFQ